eukprot:scaffold10802_cov57-Attheya_sp.AAC.2
MATTPPAPQVPATPVGTTGTPSTPLTEAERRIQSGIVKPKMGGIVILNIKECSAFSQKPTNEYVSPNQLRASNAYSSQKYYNYRKRGMEGAEGKFKIGEDLEDFERKVTTHFKESGMDTITYLPDPEHVQKMTSCLTGHSRYTVDSARIASTAISPNFDSVDAILHRKITNRLNDVDSFPALWMILIDEFQSTSIERYNSLEDTIRKLSIHQYAGQNVSDLAEAFKIAAKELTIAGQYDHNYTLKMLKAFLAAGGEGQTADDFRFELHQKRKPLDAALLAIAYKDKEAAKNHMILNKLTYEDICDIAVEEYRKLFFNENSNKFDKKGLCHNCNKPGHWARECPSKKNGSSRPQCPDNRSNQGRGFDRNHTNSNQNSTTNFNSWRHTKPADGEPQEVKKNGKTFQWCDHCKRFSTTHGTATHTGGKPPDLQANCLVADPSVWWHATIAPAES